jgi:ketosteroid isomerase-like protein
MRFVDAVNRGDIDAVEAAFHPDFEMIVPQHPARGFRGRDQEVKNMRHLMTTHPEGRIEVKRMVATPTEVWIQNSMRADGLRMEAAVIFEIDQETDTIRLGHYYSDEVDDDSPEIDEWMQGLGTDE